MNSLPLLQSKIELGRFFVYKDFTQFDLYYYLPTSVNYSKLDIFEGSSYSSISCKGILNINDKELLELQTELGNDGKIMPLSIYHNGNQPQLTPSLSLSSSNIDLSIINSLPYPSIQLTIVLMGEDNSAEIIGKIKKLADEKKLFTKSIEMSFSGKSLELNYKYSINLESFINKLDFNLNKISPELIEIEITKSISSNLTHWSTNNVSPPYEQRLISALKAKILAQLQINGLKKFYFDDGTSVNYIDKQEFSITPIDNDELIGELIYSYDKNVYYEIKY